MNIIWRINLHTIQSFVMFYFIFCHEGVFASSAQLSIQQQSRDFCFSKEGILIEIYVCIIKQWSTAHSLHTHSELFTLFLPDFFSFSNELPKWEPKLIFSYFLCLVKGIRKKANIRILSHTILLRASTCEILFFSHFKIILNINNEPPFNQCSC